MTETSSGSFFKKYDFTFIGLNLGIFLIGIINLYSATHVSGKAHLENLYKVQIGYFALSLVIAFAVSFISPKTLFRFAYIIYGFNVFLLVLVLVLGHKGMGAQRWLVLGPVRLQPSELMKVAVSLGLARWFAKASSDGEIGLKELIIPGIIALVPTILIVVQPDLGTGILLVLIFMLIAFYRKLKWRTIGIIAVLGIISAGLMYNFGLKDYQKRRITTFINPTEDVKGSGYNAIQSKIAIGSGQFFGKGFKKSSQASFNYLPENHTDFVFSIFNEEHGFFGSLVLISLYMILLFRYLWLASNVNRIFESILVVGLLSVFLFHTVINMMMVMGLLPIVGLPLPMMTYGGSSLLTFGIIAGIATSLSNSRNLF
jgi:rod shape determining protein RodA